MEQSDYLLMSLLHHIESCMDTHVRVRWDNHRLVYTATFDWDSGDRLPGHHAGRKTGRKRDGVPSIVPRARAGTVRCVESIDPWIKGKRVSR